MALTKVTKHVLEENVQLAGTESMGVPSGTTAERPSVPAAGMFRYNTTTNEFEGYTTEWGGIGGGDVATIYYNAFTGDGTTVAFTASQSIDSKNNTQVYFDGIYQSKDNYSVSGTTITFTTAPPNGTDIDLVHIKAIALTTVADGAVTTAKLADDAVSYEKLGDEFTTASAMSTDDVDFSSAQVFTKTLTANTTLTYSNVSTGMVKDLVITGNFTLTLPASTKIVAGEYDGTVSNLIQIISTNGSTEQWASISQEV